MKNSPFFGKGMKFFTAFFMAFFGMVSFFYFTDPLEDRLATGLFLLALVLIYMGSTIGYYFYKKQNQR